MKMHYIIVSVMARIPDTFREQKVIHMQLPMLLRNIGMQPTCTSISRGLLPQDRTSSPTFALPSGLKPNDL